MQIMLTPDVQAAEDRYFGKHQSVEVAPERDAFTDGEVAFIASRDSFYMATRTATAGLTSSIAADRRGF